MKAETKTLLAHRDRNEETIKKLKDTNRMLTNQMCHNEGYCPHCKNWHYPHCGESS